MTRTGATSLITDTNQGEVINKLYGESGAKFILIPATAAKTSRTFIREDSTGRKIVMFSLT